MKTLFQLFTLTLSICLSASDFSLSPCVNESGQFGFCDQSGEVVISHQFSEAYDFISGHAPVKDGDKWGIIDEAGNWMVKPVYDEVLNCDNVTDLILVRDGKKWSFINAYGIQMTHQYEVAVAWHEFEITNSTAHFNEDAWFAVIKNGKWGVIDIYDKTKIPFQFDWIRVLHSEKSNHSLVLKRGDKFSWQSVEGGAASGFIFDEYLGLEDDHIFFKKGDESIIVDANTGEEVSEALNATYALVNTEEKMGLVNARGEILIPFDHDIVNTYSIPGVVIFGQEGKLGIASLTGDVLLENKYEEIQLLELGPGMVAVNNSQGRAAIMRVTDTEVIEITDFEFNFITQHDDNVMVGLNGKIGYASSEGDIAWQD